MSDKTTVYYWGRNNKPDGIPTDISLPEPKEISSKRITLKQYNSKKSVEKKNYKKEKEYYESDSDSDSDADSDAEILRHDLSADTFI